MGNRPKWIIAVVCIICLFVGFITGYVTGKKDIKGKSDKNNSIYSTSFFTSRTEQGSDFSESGYDLDFEINKTKVSDFSQELQKVSEQIKQQYQDSSALSSSSLGYVSEEFDSRGAACTYIGLPELMSFSWDKDESGTAVSITGSKDGKIESISLETDYVVNNIRMQFFSNVYTENYTKEFSIGTRTTENIVFTESFYTTAKKKQCHMIEGTAFESGYFCIEGYIVDDGVLHHLNVTYLEKDKEKAKELLLQWADII